MKIGLDGVIMDSPVSDCGYETSAACYELFKTTMLSEVSYVH
jgi:hypothetical protein